MFKVCLIQVLLPALQILVINFVWLKLLFLDFNV